MNSSRIDKLKEMLTAEPGDSFLCYALALELENAGHPDEAVVMIEQLLQRDPLYGGAYYKLGQLLEITGNKEKAEEIYTNGIAVAKQLGLVKMQNELREALQNLQES